MIDDILDEDWLGVDDTLEELDVSILRETHPFELMCQHKDYQPDQRHMIFVYGSMKRGYPNNARIVSRHGNKCLGKCSTMSSSFIMNTRDNKNGLIVPIARNAGLGNYDIYGELYDIDGPTLLNIDLAEGYPTIYKRERVTVFLSGTLVGANVYLYTDYFDFNPINKYIIKYRNTVNDEYKGILRFRYEKYER